MPKNSVTETEDVRTYFALLRRALWGTPAGEVNSLEGALEIARIQRTRGLVYQAVLDENIPIDEKRYASFDELLLRTAYTHSMQSEILLKVVGALREKGIESVLLKGEGNSRRYPSPYLRECGDLDIYVGRKNYSEACRIVRELAKPKDAEEAISSDKHYHISIGGVSVEIHRFTHVFSPARLDPLYQKYSDDGTSKDLFPIQVVKDMVNTPEVTFNAFFIFVHTWHHFVNWGVGVRHLCDLAVFLHSERENIDRERLSSMIESLELWVPWKTMTSLMVEHLGLPKEDALCYDPSFREKAEFSLEIILEEGNFGQERKKDRKRSANYYVSKAQSLFWWIERDRRLAKAFPGLMGQHIGRILVRGFKQVWDDKTGGDD